MSTWQRVPPKPRKTTRYAGVAKHPKNQTRRPGLDKYAAHPAVEKIYEDPDGIWAELAEGWDCEGCISVHGCPNSDGTGAYEDFVNQFKFVGKTDG